MICLSCGESVTKSGATECPSCKEEFRYVSGLFGTNNISQLLQALEDTAAGTCDLEELNDRVGVFLEVWDDFAARWKITDRTVPERFELSEELEAVYGEPLAQIEEAIEHLNAAVSELDGLESAEPEVLKRIESSVRLFSRRVCSAGAVLFTKLENRGGDFDSLLEMFDSY
jgi:hypothetical protein